MKRSCFAAVLLFLAGVGAYCGYRWYDTSYKPAKDLEKAEEQQLALFASISPVPSSGGNASPENYKPLADCELINSDTVGWITVPGTGIDFPVVQCGDNDRYLHCGFDGEYNYELGCPFLDCRCQSDFGGLNSIVYAHNIQGQKMFADITLFSDSSFMESCPAGTLITESGRFNVRFFAYMDVPSNAPAYNTVFITESDKQDYLSYIFDEAEYTMGPAKQELSEREDLRLLLLSTCSFTAEDSRGILIGTIDNN